MPAGSPKMYKFGHCTDHSGLSGIPVPDWMGGESLLKSNLDSHRLIFATGTVPSTYRMPWETSSGSDQDKTTFLSIFLSEYRRMPEMVSGGPEKTNLVFRGGNRGYRPLRSSKPAQLR